MLDSQSPYQLLVVGAGPVGSIIAERAASKLGWASLVIDKRKHVAGNCHDRPHAGVLIHQYGPHYFRTNDPRLSRYLSRFTGWVPGNYFVKSFSRGEYFPFPINLLTLRQFFKRDFTPETAQAFLEEIREKIPSPRNSEEFVLSRVGREMYEAFYLGYTLKQWERHPSELETSVCGRIPVRFNEDCRYVDHSFQMTPDKGFTEMFRRMLDHPKIELRLGVDYADIRNKLGPSIATIYCGPLDEYFGKDLGPLPWRSLEFEFKEVAKEYVQPCVQINYPNEHDYTRTVEIKHVTHQKCPNTIISYEYSRSQGEPYYPIPAEESRALHRSYQVRAEKEQRENSVYFAGRLALYKYINTDEALELGLATLKKVAQDKGVNLGDDVLSG